MKIFLLEKRSKLHAHRPNLALARISTLEKEKGNEIYHFILDSKFKYPNIKPDKIYISIVFSYDCPYFVSEVRKLKRLYNLRNEDIIIGGVCTYHMYDYIKENTGISPIKGTNKELDYVIPDPEIYKSCGCDESYVFTMRSCVQKCAWCIVKSIEPEKYIIKNWKDQINMNAKNIFICDNNLLAAPLEHRKDVFRYLSKIANIKGTKLPDSRKIRTVTFDGGFDFRLLNEENLEMMKEIKFDKIRIAFDRIEYEKEFDKAVKLLLKYYPEVSNRGMHESIECYVLYNNPYTKDTIQDTLYRMYKLRYYYKIWPYAMRYQPLDTLKAKTYLSPYWNNNECQDIGRWTNCSPVFKKVEQFSIYYGRDADEKCFHSFSKQQKGILNSIPRMSLKLDFDKGFELNKPIIQEELKVREKIMVKIYDKMKQLEYQNTQLSLFKNLESVAN